MRFEGVNRPLESYARALGREVCHRGAPRAQGTRSAAARTAELAPAAMEPFFLHLRYRATEPKIGAGVAR
jgi:hypothetical protein